MRVFPLNWVSQVGRFERPSYEDADFVLYFAGRGEIARPSVFESLRSAYPEALIVGCSTGTVIGGSQVDDDMAAAVGVKLSAGGVRLASGHISADSSFEVGVGLARELARPDLAGILVLSDGLTANGSALVKGLQSVLGPAVPIGGGLAGDGPAFERTLVAADDTPRPNTVAALGFYGVGLRVGLGAAHGWDFFGPARRITRASGATLFELDGKPALELYEKYLGEEFADMPAAALRYPLLISNPDAPGNEVVRTVLAADHQQGALLYAGDVPEGWSARLMRGAFTNLAAGAAVAAEQAAVAGRNAQSGLALLVSCVGRRLLMGARAEDEIEAVAKVLPPAFKQIGFYSYGEIATAIGEMGYCGLHNQTMTIFTLSEVI